MGIGPVSKAPFAFVSFISDMEKRALYDPLYEGGEILKVHHDSETGMTAKLIYMRRKGIKEFSPTDIVHASLQYEEGKKAYYVAHSVDAIP